MSYEIVRYRPELKPEIARLQTHLWSSDPGLNTRYFEWKHEQNPYLREPQVYVALLDGRAVGMRGLYGSRWEYGPGRDIFAPLIADDMVVAPEHSNRRLVTSIMTAAMSDLADRGWTHLLNLSGGNVTVFGSLAMGWRSAGAMDPVGLISKEGAWFRRARELAAELPFFWRYAGCPFLFASGERIQFGRIDRLAKSGRIASPISFERGPRPEAMADLVARLGHDGRLRHVRDREFFSWRFRNPLHEYRFLFWGDARLDGYLVLQRSISARGPRSRVRIVDLEAAETQVCAGLLRCAAEAGHFPELVTWARASSPQVRAVLGDAGFVPVDREQAARGVPCLLVRSLGPDSENRDWKLGGMSLLSLANWDLRMVYSMVG